MARLPIAKPFDASVLRKLSNLETLTVCPKDVVAKTAIINTSEADLFITAICGLIREYDWRRYLFSYAMIQGLIIMKWLPEFLDIVRRI